VLLTVLLHGAAGSWDEIALLGLSVLIGVALAYFLGMSKKKS
jgi:uncharacterized membrane protein